MVFALALAACLPRSLLSLGIHFWYGKVQVNEPISRQASPTFSFGLAEWLGIAALAFGSLHIMLDFSVGLFPITERPVISRRGRSFLLTSLIVLWWAVSIAAAAGGLGGGLASVAVLAFGWTLLTNGSSIVFCPTPCRFGAPLADIAHVGSLTSGLAATVGALWALRHRQAARRLAAARRRGCSGVGFHRGSGKCGGTVTTQSLTLGKGRNDRRRRCRVVDLIEGQEEGCYGSRHGRRTDRS